MNKFIYLLLISFLFVSCKDNGIGNFDPIEEPDITEFSGKKGSAFTYKNETWSTRISRLQAHWHYSWGFRIQPTRPTGVEYVPMFWGKWAPNDDNVAYIDSLYKADAIDYLLAFNEPDREDQSNMSVEDAVELWPKLESLGIPLVSPAPANWNVQWMKDFMSEVEEKNLRVDYVAIHWYGAPNAGSFLTMVREVYNTYNRPIWITEFAVADWQASSLAENRYSKEEVLDFMKLVLPQLDRLPYVYRYAWYNGSPGGRVLGNSVLFDENDELTELGKFYANHNPNLEAGPGDDSWFSGENDGGGDDGGEGNEGEQGDPLFSIEAEAADLTNAGVEVAATGCANKSGSGIIFMRGPDEGEGDRELKVSGINVETAGTYALELTYFAKVETQLEVFVNDGEAIIETGFASPGFCFESSSRKISIDVELNAGENEIILSPVQGVQSPYLDKIAVFEKSDN